MTNPIMICMAPSLYIRDKPDSSGKKIGMILKDQTTELLGYENKEEIDWIYHNFNGISGYSVAQYLIFQNPEDAIMPLRQTVGTTGSATSTTNNGKGNSTTTTIGGTTENGEAIIEVNSSNIAGSTYTTNIDISTKSFKAILGLPYHFTDITDLRTDGLWDDDGGYNDFGNEYTEKILADCPILFLAPGKAEFMSSFNTQSKKNILTSLITTSEADTSIDELLNGNESGRYYTFAYDRTSYYNYVNPMCRMAAIYLKIGNRTFDGIKLKNLNWGEYTQGKLINLIGNTGEYTSVPFYVDGVNNISESFSNSSTESQMAAAVNGISDTARELNYLLGYSSSAMNVEGLDLESAVQSLTDAVGSLMGKSSFITKLSNHLSTVASGGRMIFPKIWAQSNFNRSYSVSIKLVSPDCDPYSIYLNILVPLFHLVGFVAPHQMNEDVNSYSNPFLVRAMYKGFFNIDLGLITNISISKGGEAQWTPDGIPTSVTVNLDIEDLYDVMSITESSATDLRYTTCNNTALMDYIATWCGIEVFKPEVARLINMYMSNKLATITDIPTNIWTNIQDHIANKIINLYHKF